MQIAGFLKNSLVDFPGQIASVVFTPFCNYDCFYCHNRHLLAPNQPELLPEQQVLDFLSARRGLIDGVVITGGEPTLQKDLPEFIKKIRTAGMLAKLDTNGSNPEMLKKLLDEGLLDYVAMDYKAPAERYAEICGFPADAFFQSLDVLKASGVPYELRTTMIPQLAPEELRDMLARVSPVPVFAIQGFRNPERCPEQHRFRARQALHPPSVYKKAAELCAPYAGKVELRA